VPERSPRLIEPKERRKKLPTYKRWERGGPMELWQMDVVGGVLLEDGTECKILTGVDDHSRFCVCAGIMVRATGRAVRGFFAQALVRHGVPEEILTDNGKVFTNRFGLTSRRGPLRQDLSRERDHPSPHRPASPTTTGKIERFHRTLCAEFLGGQMFPSLLIAQKELDTWVGDYNTERPHQSLGMTTPAARFSADKDRAVPDLAADLRVITDDRSGDDWVNRTVSVNGTVSVSNQVFSDVHIRL
jgi:transposase InsO family protein